MKAEELVEEAAQALRAALNEIAFAQILEIRRPQERAEATVDWLARLRLPDTELWVLVEVKSTGEPRLARDAVNQILRDQTSFPGAYGVFIAPWVSQKAAEICRDAGVGYVDLAGNCRLTFSTVHIEKTGNPNPFSEKRVLRSLYSPKAARVLRVLLDAPRRTWKLQSLADEAQVSLGQVHKVKSLLADQEWLRAEPDGIILSKPAELLAEWSQNYSYRQNSVRQYYTSESPAEAENSLTTVCANLGMRVALAAFSAAARLAPFVRYPRAYAYVEEGGLQQLVAALRLKEVPSGANLALWAPYDEGIWYGVKAIGGAYVTSEIQTYLDLHSMQERGEEAAGFLLQQVIKPQW
jgi:hypothetical protein